MTQHLQLRRSLPRSGPQDRLLERLNAKAPLGAAEEALVLGCGPAERLRAGAELHREEGAPARPRLLVSGWACYQRVLSDGRRQIFGFILPGDLIGVFPSPNALRVADASAVTALETLGAGALQRAATVDADRYPGLAQALNEMAAAEEAKLLDQIVRLGRQTAYERVAHLLLELQERMEDAGLADGSTYPLPLTQETLADALGLSIVHLNRILQQLRRERMIELKGGAVTLLDPDHLAWVSDRHRARTQDDFAGGRMSVYAPNH